MKKFIAFLFTMVFMAITLNAADVLRDPRAIATAFLQSGKEVSYYGYFSYTVTSTNGSRYYAYGNFDAEAKADGSLGDITRFNLNGYDVPLAEPLKRFPRDKRGAVTGFWMGVGGQGSTGKAVSFGNENVKYLNEGDPIHIVLRPAEILTFVRVKLPDGVDSNYVVLVTEDGMRYGYSSWYDAFYVYLDPVAGPQSYVLVDTRTGEYVGSGGTINPYTGATVSSDSALQTTREEDVESVDLETKAYWQSTAWSKLSSRAEIDGQVYDAKVYYVDNLNGDDLGVYIYGSWKGITFVRIDEVQEDGSLLHIKTVTADNVEYYMYAYAGYPLRNAVVTVYGEPAASLGIQIQFWRAWYSLDKG